MVVGFLLMHPAWLEKDLEVLKLALAHGWENSFAKALVEGSQLTDGQIDELAYLVPAAKNYLKARDADLP